MQEREGAGTGLITRAAIVGILAGAVTGTAIVVVAAGHRQRLECPSMPLHKPVASAANPDGTGTCWYMKSRYAIGALLRVRIGPQP